MKIISLKKRQDFVQASRSGHKSSHPGFVVLAKKSDEEHQDIRVGFTVSKKLGNSPQRNRIKRRLRSLARDVLKDGAIPGYDYVLIGRQTSTERPYQLLADDLKKAMARLSGA